MIYIEKHNVEYTDRLLLSNVAKGLDGGRNLAERTEFIIDFFLFSPKPTSRKMLAKALAERGFCPNIVRDVPNPERVRQIIFETARWMRKRLQARGLEQYLYLWCDDR